MFDTNCNFLVIKALRQHWSQTCFSYFKNPRPDYGIMLVLNGQIDFASPEGDVLRARAGNIIFLPKGSRYEANFRIDLGDVDNYLINFEADAKPHCSQPMLISQNASLECVELFGQFVDGIYNEEIAGFRTKGLFYLLMDFVLNQNKAHGSASDAVFEKAKNLLKKSDDIPISRIARECSVSESGLRKIFSDKIAMSPAQFRLKEKFNQAKYLLESTDLSVGEIAYRLNFYDTAYFCRLFRQKVGMSPKQYRLNKKL